MYLRLPPGVISQTYIATVDMASKVSMRGDLLNAKFSVESKVDVNVRASLLARSN